MNVLGAIPHGYGHHQGLAEVLQESEVAAAEVGGGGAAGNGSSSLLSTARGAGGGGIGLGALGFYPMHILILQFSFQILND